MSGKHKGDCCGDPWPQLMIACARVVEVYSKIFDKPELMKVSKCLRGVCKTCMCKSNNQIEDAVKEEKIIKDIDPKSVGFAFVPEGLTTREEIEKFYSLLDETNIPKLGTKGELAREEKLLKQNPLQDESVENCKFADKSSKESFEDFLKIRNNLASGRGMVEFAVTEDKFCFGCKKVIFAQTYYISTKKPKDSFWHPNCFNCDDCKDFLQDLKYCIHEDSLVCSRHYAEKLTPRCSNCDELIFNETCTRAMGKSWHTEHFWCKECNVILTGKKYAQKDDKPYCLQCYETSIANSCEKCKKTIRANAKYLIYKKQHWHEICFTCSICRKSLVNKEFISKDNDIYCERCHQEKLAPRCYSCSKTFKFGTKTIEYKNKQFHEECFVCAECKSPIGTKNFANKQDKIFCGGCYQEKFGTKCTKCKKVIIKGGVTYRNQPWHTECFSCTNCPVLLSGVTFTSHADKPYCAECFGILFAKKCFACREPINGEGMKFINYDNHHWHDNCFFCASCHCNLGGRRFVMEEDVILCPNCAKMKVI